MREQTRGRKPDWKPLTEVPRKSAQGLGWGGTSRAEVRRSDREYLSHIGTTFRFLA